MRQSTMFQINRKGHYTWLLDEHMLPAEGWRRSDVRKTNSGHATKDILGKLFFYLEDVIMTFHRRIRTLKVHFHLMQYEATQLPGLLSKEGWRFDRIETSNIADTPYLGTRTTVGSMSPLLNPTNGYSTLLTYYMRGIPKQPLPQEFLHQRTEVMRRQAKLYFPNIDWDMYTSQSPQLENTDPFWRRNFNVYTAQFLGGGYESVFEMYMAQENFSDIESTTMTIIKADNTIVEKWPTVLKKGYPEDGYLEELANHISDGRSVWLRYVEWTLKKS
ncbi:hypothetical protein F5B20DRAFT_344306 [Whalleya microplaca]|nr:hypothetical protein F5B20DRAFT_344306 [Whalleya microplaca]